VILGWVGCLGCCCGTCHLKIPHGFCYILIYLLKFIVKVNGGAKLPVRKGGGVRDRVGGWVAGGEAFMYNRWRSVGEGRRRAHKISGRADGVRLLFSDDFLWLNSGLFPPFNRVVRTRKDSQSESVPAIDTHTHRRAPH